MSEVPAAGHRPLRRVLGSLDGSAIAIGIVIGSGIFVTPALVARHTGSVGLALAVWALGGLLAFIDALVLAELASLYPKAGGNYVYLRNAYGPFPAFLNGWLSTLVTYPASYAALAVFFAESLDRLRGGDGTPSLPVAGAVIVALAALHGLGLQYGRVTQDVLAAGKLACLLAVVVLALLLPSTPPDPLPPAPPRPTGLGIATAVGLALLGVMWTYDGYADVAIMGGEIKRPGRSIPRALMGSMLAIAAVYLMANVAFFVALPLPALAASQLPMADVATALLGLTGGTVVTAMGMVSAFGALNGSMLSGPRITYAIARDGLMFRRLSWLSAGQTPVAALALQVAMALFFLLPLFGARTFEVLSSTAIFVIWLITFFAALTLWVFRRRYPDAPRAFRLPLYPYTFLIHLVVSASLLSSIVWNEVATFVREGRPTGTIWMAMAILCGGVPVYYLWRKIVPAPAGREAPVPFDVDADPEG